MSEYRVCLIDIKQHQSGQVIKFDNKEDAEHYAKNQSVADNKYSYEVQKNNQGDFVKIKAYVNGQQV